MTFETWLLEQVDAIGPVGHLACDWRDDPDRPEALTHNYLYACHACEGAHAALDLAYIEHMRVTDDDHE